MGLEVDGSYWPVWPADDENGRIFQIDWQAKKAEFEGYLKEVEAGNYDSLYDPRLAITSGPGFEPKLQLAQGQKQQAEATE